ncbi:MAG: aspartate aminotransferase family protein [Candidatus Calescibacterium sp.]|nr:aspartate aminotransferase family protein [Candidatus Calescibacterium sp.]
MIPRVKGKKRVIKTATKRLSRLYEVKKLLKEAKKIDIDPSEGKLFAYVYETGNSELQSIAKEANQMFHQSNYLDFTVFKSAMFFEKEVIKFAKKIFNADDGAVGTFTFGGTESIMIAVKSARDKFFNDGKTGKPEILVPYTIHPAFLKSADYLGLGVKKIPVGRDGKVVVDELRKNITERTALVAVSAPNWPFGVVDPVEDVAKITRDYGIPLHVDACLGGFVLPFFERLGINVPKFDFRVDGVTSISADVHKYGYAPKGASVVLFKNRELKKFSIYVDVSSPGYVLVNQTVLSSRPIGPLASAFAVIKYLDEDGYVKLTRNIVLARDRIAEGMQELGFYSLFPLESNILCLSSENINLLDFVVNMKKLGWHIHLQREIKDLGFPWSIHLAVSPVHLNKVKNFISDAKKALRMKSEFSDIDLERDIQKVVSGIISGKLDASVLPLLVNYFPQDLAVDMIKDTVISWFNE